MLVKPGETISAYGINIGADGQPTNDNREVKARPMGLDCKWADFFGRSGPYSISTVNNFQEMKDMRADGHSLAMMTRASSTPNFDSTVDQMGIKIIDRTIYDYLSASCLQLGMTSTTPCPIDNNTAAQTALIRQVSDYLRKPEISANKTITGFWILDDPPGDIRNTLRLIKNEIKRAPSPAERATVCGLAGPAVNRKAAITDPDPPGEFGYFDRSLVNFDPTICDVAVLYSYTWTPSVTVYQPELYDWKMAGWITEAVERIKRRGLELQPSWDPTTLVWGGMIMAFGFKTPPYTYLTPRSQDMVDQAVGFCAAGADFLGLYTWHDSKGDAWNEIFNTPHLRVGAKLAREACIPYWTNSFRYPKPTNTTQSCKLLSGNNQSIFVWNQATHAAWYALRVDRKDATCTDSSGAHRDWYCPKPDAAGKQGDLLLAVPASNCDELGYCSITIPVVKGAQYQSWTVQAVLPGGSGSYNEGLISDTNLSFTCNLEPVRGDFTTDGSVDIQDFKALQSALYTNNCAFILKPKANGSCLVTIEDFNEMVSIMRN